MNNSTSQFDGVLAIAASERSTHRRAQPSGNTFRRYGGRSSAAPKNQLANLGLFLGISVFFAVVFVAGLMPGSIDAPQLWTHAFIALTIAQFAMLAANSVKAASRHEQQTDLTTIPPPSQGASPASLPDQRPAALPIALESGRLNGKTYVAFSDGSVEIDTMLGRRRFVDLTAAREFVGSS